MTALSTPASDLYFTRWTPKAGGPFPVTVTETPSGRSIELRRSETPETFETTKGFLTALHGESYADRHWTIDRYLNRGRYAPPTPVGVVGITVVGGIELDSSNNLVVGPRPRTPQLIPEGSTSTSVGITVLVRKPRGIDLEARGHEVAKLLYAGFNAWIRSAGYDFEDVLQEVYRKILVANQGRSPWSPEKSSFGHYVHMVCRSALSNFHRKHHRVRLHERTGVMGIGPDGSWTEIDVRDSNRQESPWQGSSQMRPPSEGIDPVADLQAYITRGPHRGHADAALAASLVPFVHEGHTLKAAALTLGVDRPSVSRAMKLLRLCAKGWASPLQ